MKSKFDFTGRYMKKGVYENTNNYLTLNKDRTATYSQNDAKATWRSEDGETLLVITLEDGQEERAEVTDDGFRLMFNYPKKCCFTYVGLENQSIFEDELQFNDFNVHVTCQHSAADGGKSKREYPENLVKDGIEYWNKWSTGDLKQKSSWCVLEFLEKT